MTEDKYIEEFDASTWIRYMGLAFGIEASDCPLPCTTTSSRMKNIIGKYGAYEFSVMELYISQTMAVTTSSFTKFDMAKFLSDIGGSLGLWMGIGLLQLIEIILLRIRSALLKF